MRNSIRLIILFLFLSLSAFSQWRPSPYNWEYYGLKVTGPLILPNFSADPALLEDGAIRYNGSDVQIRKGGVWVNIAIGVHLDSARRSNDTLYFRRTNGGQLAVNIAGLPISATNGLADSLLNIRFSGMMDTVSTITGLQSYSGAAKILYVKDSIRGGLFYHQNTGTSDGGTVFAGTSGYWKRFYDRGVVQVGWWGDKTDAGIQSAINAADTGGVVYLQPKTRYIIDGPINPRNGQQIIGQFDTIQRCNEVKAVLQTAIATGNGNRTFNVSNATGWVVGMYINFYSTSVPRGSTAIHKILSVSGNTITTDGANTYDQAFAIGDTVITEFPMIANPLGGGPYLRNVLLSRIVFDGNKDNNNSHPVWEWGASVGLYVNGGRVEDCDFLNSKADGLIIGGVNPYVNHCRFINGNSNGVHLSGAHTPVVSNSYFYNNNQNLNTGHNEGHITFSDSIFNANIYGNWFKLTSQSGIGSLDNPFSGNGNASIHDNVFDSCTYAIMYIGNGSYGNPNIVNFNISNNRFKDCGPLRIQGLAQTTIDRSKGPGRIEVNGNYFLNSAMTIARANNINVNGNLFYKEAAATLSQNAWIFLIDNENITITGNHFYNHVYALQCDQSAVTTGTYKDKGYLIANNFFIDQSVRSIAFNSKNSGTFENIKISNNNFRNSVTNNAVVHLASGMEFSDNTMLCMGAYASSYCAIGAQYITGNYLDSVFNIVIKNNIIKMTTGYAIKIGYGGSGVQVVGNQYTLGSGLGPQSVGAIIDSTGGRAYYWGNKYIDSSTTILGATKLVAGLPGSGKVLTDTTGRGDIAWRSAVTSVGLSLPSIMSVTGSPVTTTGTLSATLADQGANTVFAGPTSGGATTPAFRALVATDIPTHDASKITSGVLPVTYGGTGLSALGSALQQVRVNSGGTALEYFSAATETFGTIYGDGTMTTFPSNVSDIILTPTANNTIDLSTSASYPGATGRIVRIYNTTNYTFQIHGVTVSNKFVYVVWTATNSPAFINL
ncbi:right-handed parallel beta-helix repeat-containing protein [Chitinophaga sp.]|uniref:right-handed parallel beta-helix repeat-containing protein n=1 Tax=Chitinophaga sp. TaxID=1869181 RepID=UPI0031CE0509